MPNVPRSTLYRRIQLVFGLILAGILYVELSHREYEPVLTPRAAVVMADPQIAADPFERLLRNDPLAALVESQARHTRDIRDYRCRFIKQELLSSGMGPEQEIDVWYRQKPYSVMMLWIRNAGQASRVIYVQDRWTDPEAKNADERMLMVCQPGELVRRLIPSLKLPVRGSIAKGTGRRSIDEFGFERTMGLLIKYGELAKSRNELNLEFRGESRFDGRPVWVLHRQLPYSGEHGIYPDRTAEILIDQEYRVPIAVYCYSDLAKDPAKLLGKYEYRDIRFNVGMQASDFEPATYGM